MSSNQTSAPSLNTRPIPTPKAKGQSFSCTTGTPVTKIARLRIMSAEDWEEFIQEWAYSALSKKYGYLDVHKCSGAGDMGRDIVAVLNNSTNAYDNYQCKHYNHSLRPTDIWVEIGKLSYWTFKKEYTIPRKYFFVAPYGIGTTLFRLLENPQKLKNEFFNSWNSYCSKNITKKQVIKLDQSLVNHINTIDFSIFKPTSTTSIIDEHSTTPYHIVRFGGGLPSREDEEGPSPTISKEESNYIRQLLDVYGEDAQCIFPKPDDLPDSQYSKHLVTSRQEFFSAECLNKFSRDCVPPGSFESLQQEIEDGIREVLEDEYVNNLKRLKETIKHAKLLPIQGHILRDVIKIKDKAGICHQLANDNTIKWI